MRYYYRQKLHSDKQTTTRKVRERLGLNLDCNNSTDSARPFTD